MSDFLTELALAFQKKEGYFKGSLAYRNNNPGNLRLTKYQISAYGAMEGERGFAKFSDYYTGFLALKDDLRAKIIGNSKYIDYSSNPTLLDLVKVYAPSGDNNNPEEYTLFIIRELPKYKLQLYTPLENLARLVTGKKTVFNEAKTILKRLLMNTALRKKKRSDDKFKPDTSKSRLKLFRFF